MPTRSRGVGTIRPTEGKGERKAAEAEEQPRYVISPEALEAEGRSAAAMALQRRCARCWGTLYQDPASAHAIPFEEHRERLRECCSGQAEYVTSQMPVLEVAFRRLLAAGPAGMHLDELHQAVVQERSGAAVGSSLSPEALRRMLAHDRYYGIREVAPTAGKSRTAPNG